MAHPFRYDGSAFVDDYSQTSFSPRIFFRRTTEELIGIISEKTGVDVTADDINDLRSMITFDEFGRPIVS